MTDTQAIAAMWELGDYDRLARRLAPAATTISERIGSGSGGRALDIAAGTGSLARELSRDGWMTTATDITPRLVDIGGDLARDDGVEVDWHVAELASQPFDDSRFDLVGSSFGLIFAVDPAAALAEVHRVLRPGGRLVYSAWTPASYIATMTAAMARVLPPVPAMEAPYRWGDPAVIIERLTPGFAEPAVSVHTLPWTFPSAVAATEFVFAHSPGHLAAHARAGTDGPAMIEAVREQLDGLAEPDGTIAIEAEYVVVTATRAEGRISG